MHILTIRTDKPEAEIGVYEQSEPLAYYTWEAHHALAETLSRTIEQTLAKAHVTLHDLQGIIIYQGPGSFTGLRIGVSVGNALADGLKISVVGTQGENWIKDGLTRLFNSENDKIVMPFYGADPHITLPKK